MKRLIAIGDSHSTFWRGRNEIYAESSLFEGLDVEHLGPATAHNLFSNGENSPYIKILFNKIDQWKDQYGAAILCFGEIDCRVHILKYSIINKKSLNFVVENTVKNYMNFVDWFKLCFNMPIIIWGPGPTTSTTRISFNANYPSIGTERERNYITYLFNSALAREAALRPGVTHASVFEDLVDIAGLTRPDALFDGCHVDVKIMGNALRALRAALVRLGVPELATNLERRWLVGADPQICNVAEGRPILPSGRHDGYSPRELTPEPTGEPCFRASASTKPHAIIDLQSGYLLHQIQIYGLPGAAAEAVRSLSVAVGLETSKMVPVHMPSRELWRPLEARAPLLISIAPNVPPVRFVLLYIQEPRIFELDTVRILAYSFDATLPVI